MLSKSQTNVLSEQSMGFLEPSSISKSMKTYLRVNHLQKIRKLTSCMAETISHDAFQNWQEMTNLCAHENKYFREKNYSSYILAYIKSNSNNCLLF